MPSWLIFHKNRMQSNTLQWKLWDTTVVSQFANTKLDIMLDILKSLAELLCKLLCHWSVSWTSPMTNSGQNNSKDSICSVVEGRVEQPKQSLKTCFIPWELDYTAQTLCRETTARTTELHKPTKPRISIWGNGLFIFFIDTYNIRRSQVDDLSNCNAISPMWPLRYPLLSLNLWLAKVKLLSLSHRFLFPFFPVGSENFVRISANTQLRCYRRLWGRKLC